MCVRVRVHVSAFMCVCVCVCVGVCVCRIMWTYKSVFKELGLTWKEDSSKNVTVMEGMCVCVCV